MLKAVILDFDGLIIDTEAIWFTIFKEWFIDNHNYNLPIDEFLWCVGSNSDRLFDYLDEKYNFQIDRKKFNKDTIEEFTIKSSVLPAKAGIEKLIKETKEAKLKLALVTSSRLEKPLFHLERLSLLNYFDYLITANDVNNIKPDPEPFVLALKRLNVKPQEAIVFEDSGSGLFAAKSAGIPTIVIPNSVTIHTEFIGYYKMLNSAEDVDLKSIIKEYRKET